MSKKSDVSRAKTLAAFAAETQTSSTDPNWRTKFAEWQHNKMVEGLRAQGEPEFGLEPVRSEADQPVLEVAKSLDRVLYVPCCVACGTTEDLYQCTCKLCFAEYLAQYRDEVEQEICELVEGGLSLGPGGWADILELCRRAKAGELEVHGVIIKSDAPPTGPEFTKRG